MSKRYGHEYPDDWQKFGNYGDPASALAGNERIIESEMYYDQRDYIKKLDAHSFNSELINERERYLHSSDSLLGVLKAKCLESCKHAVRKGKSVAYVNMSGFNEIESDIIKFLKETGRRAEMLHGDQREPDNRLKIYV